MHSGTSSGSAKAKSSGSGPTILPTRITLSKKVFSLGSIANPVKDMRMIEKKKTPSNMHGDPGDLIGAEVSRRAAAPPLVHLGGRQAQLPGGRLLEPRPQPEPPPQLRQILQDQFS
jgi:hypothetical protein